MDRRHATAPEAAFLNAPVIQRAVEQHTAVETVDTFVPAAQSRLLNGILGSAWAYQLLTIFTATAATGPAEAEPSLLFGFATALLLGLMFAMVAAVTFAVKNDSRTAPLSFAIGTGMIAFVSLCGLAGHPSSTWLGDLAFGAVVAVGSVAVFARRA